MTRNKILFQEYNSCNENLIVKAVDKSHLAVAGIGNIHISKELTLKEVLHVPNLNRNLLSVSKLIQDYNCIAKFSSKLCEFQDLDSKRTIVNAKALSLQE